MRIGIDARMSSGASGGVEQFIIGLAAGFSSLSDGDEEYVFLSEGYDANWLRPYLSGATSLHASQSAVPEGTTRVTGIPPRVPGPNWLRRLVYHAPILSGMALTNPPPFDEIARRAQVSLLHFATQQGGKTSLPSVYHPHDLQHVHLPEFFSPRERKAREHTYRLLCNQASLVAVTSTWVRDDLITHFQLSPSKVAVVPLAPVLEGYPIPADNDLAAVLEKHSISTPFIFYPAQTWKHKNHIRLVEAVADLRTKRGLEVTLVCSGSKNWFYPKIAKRVTELGLDKYVKFVGFVSPIELQSLYRLARAVIIPTLFEAASFPLWEAFHAGTPAACSSVTSLPQQANGSAIIFDPLSVRAIAIAVERLWTDEKLRHELVDSGFRNVVRFSWKTTARLFRAHYRRILNVPLSSEDIDILEAPPIL